MLQRFSALVIVAVLVPLVMTWIGHPGGDHAIWYAAVNTPLMKFGLWAVLLSILVHAWIGLKTVTGDYIKCRYVDYCILIVLLALSAWGSSIIWSI